MKDVDKWLDQLGPEGAALRELEARAKEVPERTPEQKERMRRNFIAALEARERARNAKKARRVWTARAAVVAGVAAAAVAGTAAIQIAQTPKEPDGRRAGAPVMEIEDAGAPEQTQDAGVPKRRGPRAP